MTLVHEPGEIAQSYAACLAACGGKVSCVFDSDAARAAAMVAPGSAAEGATVCATLEELLSSEKVAVVLNLTPVAAHAPVSRAALESGKHVWSEKPLAATPHEARELVELATRKHLQLGCSPLTFWGEAQQTLARHIQRGLIGTVRMAQVHCSAAQLHSIFHSNKQHAALRRARIRRTLRHTLRWLVQVDLHCGAHPAADWNQNDALAFNLGGWTRHPRMQVGSMVDVGVYAVALLTALLGPVAHVSCGRLKAPYPL
jgi:predicted dehydrogenase